MPDNTKPATMRDAFRQVVANLHPAYPDSCERYLGRLTPISYEAGTLILSAPDQRTHDMCALRLRRLVKNELWLVTGKDITVKYVLDGAPC